MNDPINLAVITGSTRKGRMGGPLVSQLIVDHAKQDDRFDVNWIDLAHADLPLDFDADGYPDVEELGRRLGQADAFVVVTPEYNHSYPAALKNAIDLYGPEWGGKAVGLASYGGNAGGQRAVEHLRQVFPEVGAMTIRETLTFVNYWDAFTEEGTPVNVEGTAGALNGFLDQLEWWASALKTARAQRAYQ
ncbi:NADPH-dependent FMN reductase [Haloglycomyces albus]|uniref:NADPH-dependent FMN reductase n=1 Tax=Haloglycomyces albus TaxID=526067 RepID=UPI0004A3B52B|nr:NAD(P)H-dependent oxidoreductase [Haloglycomyces albus]